MLVLEKVRGIKIPTQRKKHDKSLIVLTDTKRKLNDYLLMLKHRKVGGIENSPHFIISKTGKVLVLQSPTNKSNILNEKLDENIINICLENLGWVQKNTITNLYYNWIGNPCRITPYTEFWRGFNNWDRYNEEQFNSLIDLSEYLCLKHDIEFKLNLFNKNQYDLKGIVSKSYFSDIYNDINPSLKLFLK